jgi:hypothetical protein
MYFSGVEYPGTSRETICDIFRDLLEPLLLPGTSMKLIDGIETLGEAGSVK